MEGKPAESYAFPLTLLGTILVCFGMFVCAWLIEMMLQGNKELLPFVMQAAGRKTIGIAAMEGR
jgi:hypothetical protein